MADDLARAYGFLARGDMGGSRVVASPYGRAVYTDELPLRHDGNYFWVERDAEPEALVSEASRLDRPLLFVPDPATGNRLEPWFREHGWRIERHVVMAQLREPEPGAAVSLVQEVSEKELRPPRRVLFGDQPWAKPEVLDQLFAAKALIGERVSARHFAVPADGQIVSYADLYLDGRDAQIEDVGTLPDHRGRGYAKAVVVAAAQTARDAGADFVFLVADANDWPKELYGRLGFDELGHYAKFFVPGRS